MFFGEIKKSEINILTFRNNFVNLFEITLNIHIRLPCICRAFDSSHLIDSEDWWGDRAGTHFPGSHYQYQETALEGSRILKKNIFLSELKLQIYFTIKI